MGEGAVTTEGARELYMSSVDIPMKRPFWINGKGVTPVAFLIAAGLFLAMAAHFMRPAGLGGTRRGVVSDVELDFPCERKESEALCKITPDLIPDGSDDTKHSHVRRWQVMFPGPMNIRREPDEDAKILGQKWRCEEVKGHQKGEWVKLAGEHGYLKTSINGYALLRVLEAHSSASLCTECATKSNSCSASRCCRDAGKQCYEKSEGWAMCRSNCIAGMPDPLDPDMTPWTCRELGTRADGDIPIVPIWNLRPADWVARNCSNNTNNCKDSGCCASVGAQCFEKSENWAMCRNLCLPGPDPMDSNSEPWSCKTIGYRTPGMMPPVDFTTMKPSKWVAEYCPSHGQNCSEKRCCAEEGHQCFEREEGGYAACKPHCFAGLPDMDDAATMHKWSCGKLGTRTPGPIPGSNQSRAVPQWLGDECAGDNENCQAKGCCKRPGMQCFEKSPGWAVCKAQCIPGAPDMVDDGQPWSCRRFGDRTPGEIPEPPKAGLPKWLMERCSKPSQDCSKTRCCQQKGAVCFQKDEFYGTCRPVCTHNDEGGYWTCRQWGPRTPKPWGHPSLFCYSVSRGWGYEPDILRFQQRMGAGIFACDETAVMSSDQLVLLDGLKATYFAPAPVGVSKDGTAGNSQLFMNVWDAVKVDHRAQNMDWTVKVDPDAVLLPDRLRGHLSPHTGSNSYVKNCGKYSGPNWPMMFGAVEAFSKGAINSYFAGEGRCRNELGWQAWGEDLFMMRCLDHLGDQSVVDLSQVLDAVCRGYSNCGDGSVAAYHPFKSVQGWLGCWNQASGNR